MEHMAADINAAEQTTSADLVQRRRPTTTANATDDDATTARVHKKDKVKALDEWYITFKDIKVGMRVAVTTNETRAVQECRKCTVRSSGASTMYWGTKTEKEALRKNGLGKIVVIKEVDKYVVASVL